MLKRRSLKLVIWLAGFSVLASGVFLLWRAASGPKKISYGPSYPQSTFPIATTSATGIRLPIVMYHYIEPPSLKDTLRARLSTAPSVFEAQLAFLQENGYRTLFARELPGFLQKPETLPPHPMVLTFDDGYEDFYTFAFPLLQKYQAKATVYVMADYVNARGYLGEREIGELLQSGLVEIGSHTRRHLDLTSIKEETANEEIFGNKTKLETMFNIPVSSFAYPYGSFSQETVGLVKKAGYTSAVSVIPSIMQSEDNLFFLSRLRPASELLPF